MKDKKNGSSKDITALLSRLANEDYCYFTTIGRVSGNPHEIEIWFGVKDYSFYLYPVAGANLTG